MRCWNLQRRKSRTISALTSEPMQSSKQLLPGTWLFELTRIDDLRGAFVKTCIRTVFESHGFEFEFAEEFYSLSKKDVIRGMHLQLPPHDHVKVVYCAVGTVLDVLLDLRAGPSYGLSTSVVLSADKPSLVVIPSGVAHGFRSLSEGSLMVYKTSTEYAATHDCGIRWDSFGYDWHCPLPIMSDRDKQHAGFDQFLTPF